MIAKLIEGLLRKDERALLAARKRLARHADGSILVKKRGRSVSFYHLLPADEEGHRKEISIPRRNKKLLASLCDKRYCEKLIPILEKEIKLLRSFLAKFDPEEKVLLRRSLPEEMGNYITPLIKTTEEQIESWLNERFDSNPYPLASDSYDKGARGIYMHLLHMDPPVSMNLKKIRRLMKKYGLFCPIRKANPYRRMAKALKTDQIADNLLNREFEMHGARAILLTDITYIINGKAPRCYLSTIIDACTKELLAWVLSESLEIDFVLETVNIAIEKHGIEMNAETLIHSDQGVHYTSVQFRTLLKDKELRQSMSRKANCWDNAPQESFFGHMKDEIDISWCTTAEDIYMVINDWTDYYNNERYQWDLAKLAPVEYYEYLKTGVYPLKIPKSKGQR